MARGWVVVALVVARVAAADEASDREGQRLFEEGKVAFEKGDFRTAHDRFKQAYLVSSEAALLFNMSSAMQRLDRPHEAAEELRAYVRVRPDDPERPLIEERIRALEEKQRILDAERAPPSAPPPARPLSLVAAPAPPPVESSAAPSRKRLVVIALVAAAAVVVAGVAVGLGIALERPDYTPATRGPVQVTP
jgi:hypothetical protein